MTTVLEHHADAPAVAPPSTAALTTASVAGAITSAAFIVGFVLLSGQTERESTLSPYSVTVNVLTALAWTAMALGIASFARWIDVPRWITYTCAAACAGVAAMAWSLATVAAHHAGQVDDATFREFSGYLTVFPLPKMVLGLVGFTALGVVGWRRRAVPRGACVLLVLGGLTSLWWAYPPATILVGIAFAWIATSIEGGKA